MFYCLKVQRVSFLYPIPLTFKKKSDMATPKVLAFSSSRVGNSGYLEQAFPIIQKFLEGETLNIAFIPFADATNNYQVYFDKVKQGLSGLQHHFVLIEQAYNMEALQEADVIMVGGGNTFKLMHDLCAYDMLDVVKTKVLEGIPYIGWSAGSNITGPGIFTTNDMPIIEPKSFKSLGFFPFQLNPHYVNVKPAGFHGETRNERLHEFLLLNPTSRIVGLPEGTALQLENNKLLLLGESSAILFMLDADDGSLSMRSLEANSDVSWLL